MKRPKYQKEYEEALLNPPLCGCRCGEKLVIKPYHRKVGIPKYIHGHGTTGTSKYYKEYEEALIIPPLCGCQCGGKIVILSHHRLVGIPKFIHGHNWRNKKHTEESKKKISVSQRGDKNTSFGKQPHNKGKSKYEWVDLDKDSELYCGCNCGTRLTGVYRKDKLPRFTQGHNPPNKGSFIKGSIPWCTGSTGVMKAWNKGKSKYPDLDVNQIVYCACNCGGRIIIKPHHKYHGTPRYINGHQYRAQEFRLYNTAPELIITDCLKNNSICFTQQKNIYGFPDFFIEPDICIFVDGDYWHGNPKFYIESDLVAIDRIAKDIWDKDKRVTNILIKNGYAVLRFWEYEIYNNLDNCVKVIKEAVEKQHV